MVDFEFDIRSSKESHVHQDIELLYLISGRLNITVEDKSFLLVHDDFLIVNPGETHAFVTEENALIGSFHISYEKLRGLLKRETLIFRCNSVSYGEESGYKEARAHIKEVLDCYTANRGRDVLELQVMYYRLLHALTTHFLVSGEIAAGREEKNSSDARKHEIEEYIIQNYEKALRLNDLAERLHLSAAYLSKYIKKQFGMSFLEYVNKVRLGHAVTELMYSDKSVARISMDMGFANLTSFNRLFKENYQMTPSVFRRQHRVKLTGGEDREASVPDETYQITTSALEMPENKVLRQSVNLPGEISEPLEKMWNKMINIGAAEKLLHSAMQEHVLRLRDVLGFQYIRFWDIYAPELLLETSDAAQSYNFGKLDRILDFLVNNRLKPYIELCDMPRLALPSPYGMIRAARRTPMFESDAAARRFMRAFVTHLVNRYGLGEVSCWYFEYRGSEMESPADEEKPAARERVQRYIRRFSAIAGAIRSVVPGARVGGAGFALQKNTGLFDQVLNEWVMDAEKPSFISMYCFPFDRIDVSSRVYNMDALHRMLSYARHALEKHGFANTELHVSEWNVTERSRVTVNDTCFKAAYMMKSILDNLGMADVVGCWVGSDLFDDSRNFALVADGTAGLLTQNGITKPSWYALDFLNNLGGRLYRRGENYAVTNDGYGNWRIVCHNQKNLNYRYYLEREEDVNILDQDKMLADNLRLRLRFELPAGEGQRYRLKTYAVNREHGSVLDAWIRMCKPQMLDTGDLKYLKCISVPQMTIREIRGQTDCISFETELEPNEIQLILVDRMIDQIL